MLARAVYRAALRASSAVRRSGHPLLLMPPVTSDEWGSSRHLKPVEAARDRDARRNELFPWAATEDSAETAGALSGDELRELARRTFRAPVEDEDLALDDALAALRSLNSLVATHAGASVQVTEGVRVIAMASWLGVTAKGHNVRAGVCFGARRGGRSPRRASRRALAPRRAPRRALPPRRAPRRALPPRRASRHDSVEAARAEA